MAARARNALLVCMALLIAFGSVAASHEVNTLTAAVHDLLAAVGLDGSEQSTGALCRAVIAEPTPQQDANPPLSSKAAALAEHGHPSPTGARWTDHAAAVLHAAGSSAEHDEALRALEAHTHPMQTLPPLVDEDPRLKGAAPSQAPGSTRRSGLGSSPEARARPGGGAGTKVGASKVLLKERQLRRRAEAARDAAEARERDLTRELQRERARRRRAEAA